MSEVTYKGNQPIPSKPRKSHSGLKFLLWFFLTIFIFIPLLLVGSIYACFYDGATANIPVKEDYPTTEVLKSTLVDSFDYTKTQHKMRVRLTRENLNQLLYNAIKDVKVASKGVIQNLYVDFGEQNYYFNLEINAINLFKTRIILTTDLTVDETEMTFSITDVTCGRIHGLNNVLNFIKQFVALPDLTTVLAASGLHMKVDLANLRITYAMDDFTADLTNMLGSSGDYGALLGEMLSNNTFRTLIPYSDNAIELAINLEAMRTTTAVYNIPNYTIPAGYITNYATNACTTVKNLLDTGKITVDDASAITKYYIVGYDHLNTTEKSRVDYYLDAGNISAAVDTYDFTIAESDQIDYIVNNQVDHQVKPAPYGENKLVTGEDIIVELNTAQIDKVFKESKLMETIISFAGKGSDGKYKNNYIAFNRVTSTIKDNNLFITLSVDFNGYDINLTVKTTKDTSYNETAAVRFEISDIYIGDQLVSEDTKTMVMDLIKNNLSSDSFGGKLTVTTVNDKTYITINMKNAFSDSTLMAPLMSAYQFNFSSANNTSTENGILRFTAHRI